MTATEWGPGGGGTIRRRPEGVGTASRIAGLGTASRIAGAAAAAWLVAACSGAAGPGAGGGEAAASGPVLEPVPAEVCAGPALPDPATRSEVIENPATIADPRDVYAWSSRADANLGVGHLRVEAPPGDGPPGAGLAYEWPRYAVFPLFDAPAGEHIGWFDQGWVVLGFGYDRLHRQGSGAGQVETGYEEKTLVVLETAPDGWYRIRHTEPRADEPGTAWVHACHLLASPAPFSYEPWEERFGTLMRDSIPVHFRAQVRHSLRAGPSTDSARVAWIPADEDETQIHILEIAGDWMRVSVQTPRTWCGDEDVEASVEEGWITWRDEEKGPWVWWYTRGC